MARWALVGCALLLLGCPERNPLAPVDAPGDLSNDAPEAVDAAEESPQDATEEAVGDVAEDDPCAAMGMTLCDGVCVDLNTNGLHCGQCGANCGPGAGALRECSRGACRVISCVRPALDCDGVASNGCEFLGMPREVTECLTDYYGEGCFAPRVMCGVIPVSCFPGTPRLIQARVYSSRYLGHVLTFPRPARRVRLTFAGEGGAGCQLTLRGEHRESLLSQSVGSMCISLTDAGYRPLSQIDYNADGAPDGGASDGGAGSLASSILLQHVSDGRCYVAEMELTY